MTILMGLGIKSPFASTWFCGLAYTERTSNSKSAIDTFVKFHPLLDPSQKSTTQTITSLQEYISKGSVYGERRKNSRQRWKMWQQAILGSNRDVTAVGGVKVNTGDTFGVQSANKKRKPGSGDFEHRRRDGISTIKKSKFT